MTRFQWETRINKIGRERNGFHALFLRRNSPFCFRIFRMKFCHRAHEFFSNPRS